MPNQVRDTAAAAPVIMAKDQLHPLWCKGWAIERVMARQETIKTRVNSAAIQAGRELLVMF